MAKDSAFELAKERIEAARQSGARKLDLGAYGLDSPQLSTLPKTLGELTQLEYLDLSNNQLSMLPEWLSRLTKLKSLRLPDNQFSELPEWIGNFKELQFLEVSENRLIALPQSIGKLQKLKELSAMKNRLQELPVSICMLRELQYLWLHHNGITKLPEAIGNLTSLRNLGLYANKITSLPPSFAELHSLSEVWLSNNQLGPELAAAESGGVEAIKRYLRELRKGESKRYEAKLLILGDGNEGKTCISRALRGYSFEQQVTTRGVDVEQWQFEHPDHRGDQEKEITLNIWDFEGQEINHQTHQFFLTSQALYLLVFKCRDQFQIDRAEYWLDTIRARAPKAKVAITITQCEERTPYVPQDRLQAQYADLLVEGNWLFPVGCADNSGISELQSLLQRWAADLKFMGREWPESYSQAEAAIKETAKAGTAHINRAQLHKTFRQCGIDESMFSDVAISFSNLGIVTQFPDCPDLYDFIVLQPQWLTKAISEIMEDKRLATDKGDISLRRMESIWENKKYSGLFATFHNCMKEFELCYDLEDATRSCLVPLRFGYEKPEIPWTATKTMKERRVEYKLNIRPPTGIMSRFIVKTHHMIVKPNEHPKGIYWHNGVFLRTGSGPLSSEALCEFDSDVRKLRIRVRAAFPQNLLEQIHGYVKAVFSFFSGLEAERSYGCIKFDNDTHEEIDCGDFHTERRIFSEILNSQLLNCEYSFHKVNPQRLIFGFSSFGEFVLDRPKLIELLRSELDKRPKWAESLAQTVGVLLSWLEDNSQTMEQLIRGQATLLPEIKQELELKLYEYLGHIGHMLDDRDHTAAPGIVSISTKDRSKWNPTSYFQKIYLLTPFCECPGNIHPCEDSQVEFAKDRDWWEKTAPWIARSTKILAAGLQLAFAGMPLALGPKVFDSIKDDVKFMNELTKHLELSVDDEKVAGATDLFQEGHTEDLRGLDKESRLLRAALARFFEETAPNNYRAHQWGSLSRVRMSDNSFRWMCQSCAKGQVT